MSNKILLADDSITIQKVVNLTFTDEGINVVTVGNGELALKKLAEEEFDLVLADIFMPGRNGYEVCEYVKTNAETRDLPVILLVGAFEPFDKSEAARVRADGHLTKPFESRILIETVKRMLAEAAVHRAQTAPAASQDAGYRGQVVGWDVPTQQMTPQHLAEEEEPEPEPPPYDPYASTAKLPPISQALHHQSEPAVDDGNHTLSLGAPLPTGALFTPPGAEPPPDVFEYGDADAAAPEIPAQALEGPPDSVAGFSFTTASGPLPETELEPEPPPVDDTNPIEPPSIGYHEIHASDSPLDLPDIGVIEQHTHEPAHIAEVRDPLLETFADVAESTHRVDAPPAPGLEVNVHEDAAPSMTVGATEGIISAWDPKAQPEERVEAAPPEPTVPVMAEEEPVAAAPEPHDEAHVSQTQPFSASIPLFGFSHEQSAESAPLEAPFGFGEPPPFEAPPDEPAVAEPPPASKPTVGLSDLPNLSTIRSGPTTERFSPEDFQALVSHTVEEAPAEQVPVDEAPAEETPVEEAPVEEAPAEPAPSVWEPEVEVEAAPSVEEAPAEEISAAPEEIPEAEVVAEQVAVPVNGSGAEAAGAVPREIIDEVVRRTVERINDDVIREIAWEVVPDLAEQLIKKRLNKSR